MPKIYEGHLLGQGLKFGIVAGPFYGLFNVVGCNHPKYGGNTAIQTYLGYPFGHFTGNIIKVWGGPTNYCPQTENRVIFA